MKRHNKLMDMKGQTFGRLKVLNVTMRHDSIGRPRAFAWVRCDCGTQGAIDASGIFYGRTKSCGCLRAEGSRARMTAKHAARREA